MIKISLIFTVIILLTLLTHAQDCNEGSLAQKPGMWKDGLRGSVSGINASDLAKERAVLASIHSMIKTHYSPLGVEANCRNAFFQPYPEMPANTYSYNIQFLPFYCDGNNMKIAHESSTSLMIGINLFDSEIYQTFGEDASEAKGFHSMDDMPVKKDGYYFFKEKNINLGFGIDGKTTIWLITNDDQLPYAYVSQRTFLEKRKQLLARDLPLALAGLRENLKMNELVKVQLETEYKSDPEKLKRYLKNTYPYNKEKYEKGITKTEQEYKRVSEAIETKLKLASSDLDQPAIVKQDPNDYLSFLFTTDDDPFGRVLIQPNPGYFNKKMSRGTPQFITIQIIGDMQNKIAVKTLADIVNAFDFTALKKMLGK